MDNPICIAMGWPIPGAKEQLHISLNGKHVATLSSSKNGYAEGLYLVNPQGVPYGPCFAAGPGPRAAAVIKNGLANKLRVRPQTLSRITIATASTV